MSFVAVDNVFKSYGPRPILERINLKTDKGEFISIVGASGCGKSTFLRSLIAQEQPTHERISIDGNPLQSNQVWNVA
ncbi:ATP-binding cassette domain-containing protein [Parasulfitobacter algicola]|uniref:ATP-binding cassette domain-containing protein n=1 Tax=Parasulfitobacter algicola TaxID=2614809 RepID=UPI002483EB63|nr:ATP-binding cassette domain-containing protein [Sulfitobacter algicola]